MDRLSAGRKVKGRIEVAYSGDELVAPGTGFLRLIRSDLSAIGGFSAEPGPIELQNVSPPTD